MDLYQYTEGSQESALVRFVNELLGLDQLNALRSGLHDATDIRRVRKLSSSYAEAESEAADIGKRLAIARDELSDAETELTESCKRIREALGALGFNADVTGREINFDEIDLNEINLILANGRQDEAIAETERLHAGLLELHGRIGVLRSLPMARRIDEARTAAVAATAAVDEWRTCYEAPITELRHDAASLGIDTGGDLADEGVKLQAMTEQRTELKIQLLSAQREVSDLDAVILTDSEFKAATARLEAVTALNERLNELSGAIHRGAALRKTADDTAATLADIQTGEREQQHVTSELAAHAAALGEPAPTVDESPEDVWQRLDKAVTKRSRDLNHRNRVLSDTAALVNRLRGITSRHDELTADVTELHRAEQTWDQRLQEATRRRDIARAVHKAASATRASIVERVFTQSLNDVWGDVFSRLAPCEPFMPVFGTPTTKGATLKLSLETIHESGDISGTPSMMLSAGNLNTAALSLFIALHLAVEPQFPCLVFDDPVQSMDEVHITQFAGLLRMLSKQHGRQIVIAVHERELFEYLRLELSPAFENDKLITVELDSNPQGDPFWHSTPFAWSNDKALADEVLAA